MQIRDFSLPSPYSTPLPCRYDSEEHTLKLEEAAQNQNWPDVIEILQSGKADTHRRDAILLEALETLPQEACIHLVAAARASNALPAATDSRILEIAAKRCFPILVIQQLENGLIQPWAADSALAIAARNNHRDLIDALLSSPYCTQKGKNLAALAATESGALGAIRKLLEKKAISGNFTKNSYLDKLEGTELCKNICSLLIRVAVEKDHFEIADKVAYYMANEINEELTEEDLVFLAIGAAGAGQKEILKEILSTLKIPLHPRDREAAENAAKKNGHFHLVPILRGAPTFSQERSGNLSQSI